MLRNIYGRYVNHRELYPLLGLDPNGHLPRAGFQTKTLSRGDRTVFFKCEPTNYDPGQGRTSAHRVKFLCDCRRWIPFGRAGQHLAACKTYIAIEAARASKGVTL